METPVYQQYILYDQGSKGAGVWPSGETKDNLVNLTFTTPWFFVQPNMWYAVWFWCGGDIHAAGWDDETGFGSTAFSSMDVSVPSFMLHFRSTKGPLPKPKAKPKTTKAKVAKAKPKAATKKSGTRR